MTAKPSHNPNLNERRVWGSDQCAADGAYWVFKTAEQPVCNALQSRSFGATLFFPESRRTLHNWAEARNAVENLIVQPMVPRYDASAAAEPPFTGLSGSAPLESDPKMRTAAQAPPFHCFSERRSTVRAAIAALEDIHSSSPRCSPEWSGELFKRWGPPPQVKRSSPRSVSGPGLFGLAGRRSRYGQLPPRSDSRASRPLSGATRGSHYCRGG